MENTSYMKVYSQYNNLISLNVAQGHFATSQSHINYYIDMTTLKARRNEAKAAAKALVQEYVVHTVIDTIVCLDGTEIIGAYLADELTSAGIISENSHNTVYIITPEQNTVGQLMFKENYLHMIKNKRVLVLLATATTGKTVNTALGCIEYYGGTIVGVSAIFSAAKEIHGRTINSIFSTADIPDYATYPVYQCPYCQAGQPLNALVNSHGFTRI